MTRRLLTSGVLGLLVLHPSLGVACDCDGPPELKSQFESSDIVALVRVAAPLSGGGGQAGTPLEVVRSWRGARAGETLVLARAGSDCDYRMQLDPGTEHLLYMHRSRRGLTATGGGCGRSAPAQGAREEIHQLDLLAATFAATPAASAPIVPAEPPAPAVPEPSRAWTPWVLVVGALAAAALVIRKIHRPDPPA